MKPAMYPFKEHQRYAAFGSDDGENWRRLCGVTINGDSIEFAGPVRSRWIVIGYDESEFGTAAVTFVS